MKIVKQENKQTDGRDRDDGTAGNNAGNIPGDNVGDGNNAGANVGRDDAPPSLAPTDDANANGGDPQDPMQVLVPEPFPDDPQVVMVLPAPAAAAGSANVQRRAFDNTRGRAKARASPRARARSSVKPPASTRELTRRKSYPPRTDILKRNGRTLTSYYHRTGRGPQKCGSCGKPRKGHECEFKNLTSQTASTAASRELLKAAEARRMEAYSARVARGNQAPAKRSKTGKSSPAKYRCSICGMIKEGHICPGKIVNPVDVRAPVAGGGVTSNAPADDDEEFLQACEEIATATTDGSFSKMTNPFATNTGDGADHSGMAALGQKPFKAEAGEVIDPNDVDDDDDDDSEEEMLLLPYDCRGFPKDDGNNDDDYDHGSGGNAPSASGMFVLHA